MQQLQGSPFFAAWTVASLERLYFMMERRRSHAAQPPGPSELCSYPLARLTSMHRILPGDDVVTQGDVADFCFVIASGACDIVVALPPQADGMEADAERVIMRLPAGTPSSPTGAV